jgi:hypothetical protein
LATHFLLLVTTVLLFLVFLIFLYLCFLFSLLLDDDVGQGNTEKVPLRVLHEAIPHPQQAAAPPAGPLGREALPLLHLHEGLHPEGPSQHPQEAGPPGQGVPVDAAAAAVRLLGRGVGGRLADTHGRGLGMRLELGSRNERLELGDSE